MPMPFPFTAIVGQDDLKLALMLTAVDPALGGVLAFGDRGTGKSTAVRALAALLPRMQAVEGCPYNCKPVAGQGCEHTPDGATVEAVVPVIDMPLGATEDRVVGALDLERALSRGEKHFEPGLLARANRGYLYIDEVNLLEDHLVDLLLDVAASGENLVEREGLSVRHPARFVLIGSGNPEEGELRPQLLDRFGLSVDVRTPTDIDQRIEAVRRRDAFDRQPEAFLKSYAAEETATRKRLVEASAAVDTISLPDDVMRKVAELCLALGTDGLRGELTLIRAARALAAFDGDGAVNNDHVRRIAPMALGHRLRRNPLDDAAAGARVERALKDLFPVSLERSA